MAATRTKQKASKGTVRIKTSNDRLQLVFSHGGKRHYLSLGLPDTKLNQRAAEAKAKLIESDIAFEKFDSTLAKYRSEPEMEEGPEEAGVDLLTLWTQFVEFKRPQCSPNTMRQTYGPYTNHVKRFPTYELAKANEIRDYILLNLPLDAGKRLITRLAACCEWAVDSKHIDDNPFQGMASKIKMPKATAKKGLNDINPFSLSERDAIIKAIETDQFCPAASSRKHSYYGPLVKFLFATGCRPSEAVALTWQNVASDCKQVTFAQALINTDSGKEIRLGLKTQEQRSFPCNRSLKKLLKMLKSQESLSKALVFPSPAGKMIDTNNFRNRIWKRVLDGLGIEYRKLYQTRHTFITHALEAGMDAKDVARLVGNSPEIIYRHYAGKKRKLEVPEF